MQSLIGKTILVGKDPAQGRLMIAIDGGKAAAVGSPSSVPNSVSRCRPAEHIAHAKITVDQNGDMILTNLKDANVTYVNGTAIESKRVLANHSVELGKDHFGISIPVVIDVAKKLVAVPGAASGAAQAAGGQATGGQAAQKQTYSIAHLEYVWDNYHDGLMALRKKQRNQANLARIPMIMSMGGSALVPMLGAKLGMTTEECLEWTKIISGLGCLFLLGTLFVSYRDTSLEDQEALSEEFQSRYTCPNPDCRKFLGNLSYKLLLRQYGDNCPYCKCGYSSKK